MRPPVRQLLVLALALAPPLALVASACRSGSPAPASPSSGSAAASPSDTAARPPGWCKGNTHVHTGNSGDSETPAAAVATWYEREGFDFIVMTDHSYVTVLEHGSGPLVVMPGVEITYNLRLPPDGTFLPVHMNALFVPAAAEGWVAPPPITPATPRADLYRTAMKVAGELGGLAVLAHPNFGWAVDAALLTTLTRAGLRHFEVANEAIDSNNLGGEGHPSAEALWDAVLSNGLSLYGVASDDAHHYDDAAAVESAGMQVFRGHRGWVMVRAKTCSPEAIRTAMEGGGFYATRGPILSKLQAASGTLSLVVAGAEVIPPTIRFIGRGGRLLHEVHARSASYTLEPGDGYVRATVESSGGAKAWIQPLRP